MDLDAVADELYALPPADFTAARDKRAKDARTAGDRKLAERIRRLRRPTKAAWASNLLVRRQPDEAEQVLRLGEALRQAHRDLDGGRLRKLSAQQRQVIAALARQARDLTTQAGQPIGEGARREVEETLRAVLADPEAGREWVRGRLTKPLTAPTGFPLVAGAARSAPPTSRDGERAAGSRVADLDAARSRRRERQEQERRHEQERERRRAEQEKRREQRERRARAHREAEDAERRLRAREAELTAAEEEQGRAAQRRHQAQQRLADLRKRLKEAEGEQREADDAVREARTRARKADRAVHEARRRATDAAAQAEQLTGQGEPPTV
ncbi:hypothetical protein [Streptomyces rapamycinicus]|uniref:Uncharacterized protein n=2 Tax=Streptomyces rapamycinicus TaxID=1226757 RepID=A0A0A0N753_STRRN|nr:hypothetical protein [Streptomyces rapamycinicus]AGP52354.1 hypothetical protein M271_03620 [Streptomyces rapamycinicus NRRL 5491]MBB4779819.1 hypothetical protein [Streptomyces rapamycinicus]RLV75524.1 hypothetical protein D3C57_139900 [Streptomyces rapamycinicus NRRL 5491]UTP28539.1 hypothetical protein LIV37_03760 [Streptomyces rapamycinicus NRRL 5491]